MATNIIVARGGVEYVPPISLAFWRWLTVFLILFPFVYNEILKNKKNINKEFWKLFFLGSMGCGVCGAFPFIAGMSTTMANMGIIYTSSPIFIIILSVMFFKDKINLSRIIGLILCLTGVLAIISKGKLDLLINFKFTSGDLWMVGAAIGWAVYSIYLLNCLNENFLKVKPRTFTISRLTPLPNMTSTNISICIFRSLYNLLVAS